MRNNARIFGAEALGTAVLVGGGVGTAVLAPGIEQVGVALAFGFSVLVMVYVIGPVSGGHMNPAITLAMRLARKIDTAHAVVAWAGQILGGVLGALVVWGIANGQDDWSSGSFAANGWAQLSPGAYGLGSVIVAEVVFTALLVLVALSASSARFAAGIGGVAVGLTYALIHLVSLQIDGTGVNPARSVGAATEVELKEKKHRIEDAVSTTKAAIEEGVVPGGGVALLRSQAAVLKAADGLTGDEATGARLVARSLEGPLKQIAENAGLEGGVAVERVRNMSGNEGLNAATGEYEDLVKLGVIDAAKVTRSALQNAASIAALFLTTEAVVADKPEPAAPAMPGGGMEDF